MASELPPGVDLSKIPGLEPPPGVVPNFNHPQSQAYATIVGNSVVTALMVVIVTVRLWAKLFITKTGGWDDVCCILATSMTIAQLGMLVAVFNPGFFGSHQWDVPVSTLLQPETVVLLRAENFLYGPAMIFAKLSILLFYFQLFKINVAVRISIHFMIVLTVLLHTIGTFTALGMCPSSDPIAYSLCASKLVPLDIAISAINIFSDFFILAIPMFVIPKLQLRYQRKIGLMAVFLTGFLACVSSILCLVYRIKMLDTSDTTWYIAPLLTFTLLELNIAIMIGCVPVVPAFCRKVQTSSVFISLTSGLKSSKTGSMPSSDFTTNYNPQEAGPPYTAKAYAEIGSRKMENGDAQLEQRRGHQPDHGRSGHHAAEKFV